MKGEQCRQNKTYFPQPSLASPFLVLNAASFALSAEFGGMAPIPAQPLIPTNSKIHLMNKLSNAITAKIHPVNVPLAYFLLTLYRIVGSDFTMFIFYDFPLSS
jgi:hypothetical protein